MVILTSLYGQEYQSLPALSTDDLEIANQLFEQVEQAKKEGHSLTQSQAQMSVVPIQNKIKKLPKLATYKDIIHQAFEKEQEFKATHYVFYTAIPYMRLFQDITRKLFQIKIGKIGALKEKSFQFIRYTHDDPTYSRYPDVTTFLIHELEQNGIIDDNETRLKTILVSTNLAFFGNAGLEGESTYNYFISPQVWARAKKEWLESCLKSFGYDPIWAEKFLALQELTKTETGDLFQIFIPKNLVNQIGYISWRQGIPFDLTFIKNVFDRTLLTMSPVDQIYAKEINERLATIKQKWKERDPATVSLVEQLINNVKSGKYHLTPFLELYKLKPIALKYLNYYQARLLITNELLLNPLSGINIFRYSTLSKENELKYKQELNALISHMTQSK